MKKINFKIILTVLLIVSVSFSQQKKKEKPQPLYKRNLNYDQYMSIFNAYKVKKAKIVFLGNSITEAANWPELLGRKSIANRGIPGDILEGFIARLDGVIKLRSDICIIMGGINDVYAWIPVDVIYKNYQKIIRKLKRHGVKPIIVSTLYAGINYPNSQDRNKEVTALNKKLKKYAKKSKIEFLDLNEFLSENGFLKNKVSTDGVHLNWRGYKIWAEKLDKILVKNGY